MVIRIELYAPHLEERARRIIERGYGFTWDMELIERIVQIARREDLEVEFVRLEEGNEVVLSLKDMEIMLEQDWEVRPLDSWKEKSDGRE